MRDYILQYTSLQFAFCVTTKKIDHEILKEAIYEVKHISEIREKAEQYFVVAFPKETNDAHLMFKSYGFESNNVFYVHHQPIRVTREYKDGYGNSVSKLPDKCTVILEGYGNIVNVGNVTVKKSLTITCGNNSTVIIKDGTVFAKEFDILARDLVTNFDEEYRPDIEIDEGNAFLGGRITSFSGKIHIFEKSSFGENFRAVCGYGMEVIIKKMCMFSHDIVLQAADGHLIFDCNTNRPINSIHVLEDKKKKIKIGEHVWVGLRVVILDGTQIGCGSVVGAVSFVKGCYMNNCIIAGNPARIIRKDIAWSRQPVNEDIALCGEEYIALSNGGKNDECG